MSFKALGVHAALIPTLESAGITRAFPIQSATLPDAISGRDILGRGQTGSGKTLAFGLAMITRLAHRKAEPFHPIGLILSPTRELAMQISEALAPLARSVNLNTQVIVGGLGYSRQIQGLRRGVPILVATPGRLLDLIKKEGLRLDKVEITVLDEADQMSDMGFLPVVKEILSQTKSDGQRMLFSATLDRDVDALVKRFLKNPKTHSVANVAKNEGKMVHHVLILDQGDKDKISAQIAAREGRTIFFVRTKHGADRLVEKMLRMGVAAGALHGGKSQNQRTRILESFKSGATRALIATDVAARGIHVDDVSLVVHVDSPENPKDYLHRAGRTARAGAEGVVVTLATAGQRRGIHGMTSKAGVVLKESKVRPMDANLVSITGAMEPSGIALATKPALASSGGSGGRSSRHPRARGRAQRGESGQRPFKPGKKSAYKGSERRPAK
jgi:superfamily II DNA/RNA helicase